MVYRAAFSEKAKEDLGTAVRDSSQPSKEHRALHELSFRGLGGVQRDLIATTVLSHKVLETTEHMAVLWFMY